MLELASLYNLSDERLGLPGAGDRFSLMRFSELHDPVPSIQTGKLAILNVSMPIRTRNGSFADKVVANISCPLVSPMPGVFGAWWMAMSASVEARVPAIVELLRRDGHAGITDA
jgi:hypothetical protein